MKLNFMELAYTEHLRTSLRENREKLEMRIRNPPFLFCMELALLGG